VVVVAALSAFARLGTLRPIKGIARSVAGLCAGLLIAAAILAYLDRSAVPASDATWTPSELSQMLVALVTAMMGMVIASRRPGNPFGWLALAAGGLGRFSQDTEAAVYFRCLEARPTASPP
jgi:hypothetical protein